MTNHKLKSCQERKSIKGSGKVFLEKRGALPVEDLTGFSADSAMRCCEAASREPGRLGVCATQRDSSSGLD